MTISDTYGKPTEGTWVLAAKTGSPKANDLSQTVGVKGFATSGAADPQKKENPTETADTYYLPTAVTSTDADTQETTFTVNVFLGNNGKLAVEDGVLMVGKKLVSDNPDDDHGFSFDLTISNVTGTVEAGLAFAHQDHWDYRFTDVWAYVDRDGWVLAPDGKRYEQDGITFKAKDTPAYVKESYAISISPTILEDGHQAFILDSTIVQPYQGDAPLDEPKCTVWETSLDERNVGCINKFDGKVWCTAHYAQEEVVFVDGQAHITLTPGKSYVFPGLRNNVTYTIKENLTPEEVAAGYQLRYYETNDGSQPKEPSVTGTLSDSFCNVFCVNSLTKKIEVIPELQKKYITVVGEKPLDIEDGLFKFALTPKEGNPTPDPVSSELVAATDTTGKVTWSPLEYDRAGTWVYFIEEIDPNDRLIEWDKGRHTLIIEVTEDDSYKLHTQATYDDGENLEITNRRINYANLPATGSSGITSTLQVGSALCALGVTGALLSKRKPEKVKSYKPKHLAKKR